MKKRAVVLLGAGASVEYKAHSTAQLTAAIERSVMADGWMKHSGGDTAYTQIKTRLAGYLSKPEAVNFEHIYHCAHELLFVNAPGPHAVDEFRPLMVPFLTCATAIPETALRALVDHMAKVIYAEMSAVCDNNPISLNPLRAFFGKLRADNVLRIYTTNYDDFPLQAEPSLYTGFPATPSSAPKPFDVNTFWLQKDLDSIFHLHGSVHMGFPPPTSGGGDIGELFWFDYRADALKHCSFNGGDVRLMDGSSFVRTSVITGLNKLSRLQQRPMSHFYAAMANDLMSADIIYVIGSGLGDLHLNTWLQEARARNPRPPILFVDYWAQDFLDVVEFDFGRKEIEMFHALKIHVGGQYRGARFGSAWTLASDRSAAIWGKGFQSFLAAASELDEVLSSMRS